MEMIMCPGTLPPLKSSALGHPRIIASRKCQPNTDLCTRDPALGVSLAVNKTPQNTVVFEAVRGKDKKH